MSRPSWGSWPDFSLYILCRLPFSLRAPSQMKVQVCLLPKYVSSVPIYLHTFFFVFPFIHFLKLCSHGVFQPYIIKNPSYFLNLRSVFILFIAICFRVFNVWLTYICVAKKSIQVSVYVKHFLLIWCTHISFNFKWFWKWYMVLVMTEILDIIHLRLNIQGFRPDLSNGPTWVASSLSLVHLKMERDWASRILWVCLVWDDGKYPKFQFQNDNISC